MLLILNYLERDRNRFRRSHLVTVPKCPDYCIVQLMDASSLSRSRSLAGSASLAFQRSSQLEEVLTHRLRGEVPGVEEHTEDSVIAENIRIVIRVSGNGHRRSG